MVVEAIQIYGEDVYYIPYNLNNYDVIYGADDQKSYTWAIPIEMYMKSFDSFGGDGDFFSKFGAEVRDQMVWTVAQTRFLAEIGSQSILIRPREGDLIFFPLNNQCFQIKSVSKLEAFFQLGALHTWEMTCELFEYTNQIMATGIPQIDNLQVEYSTNILDFAIQDENGYPLRTEQGYYILMESYGAKTDLPEDEEIKNESSQIIDFSVQNPFSEDIGN